jgi:SsrA-binding protein
VAKGKVNKVREIVNRQAKFEYHFLDEYEAGILLTGTEIKSIREGNANLREAFCTFNNGELFVRQMFIAEYKYGNQNNHEPKRKRKLLLHKRELEKLEKRVKAKGFTIVPYKIYLSERGFAKVQIVLAQGKKSYDKRESIKARDTKRDLARMKKHRSSL